MTAMARPKPGREAQSASVEDDPLVELARIVSGRSTLDEPPRRSVFEEESGISEADLARDLEAELLSDLQATFAAAGEADDEQPPFYAAEDMADESDEYVAEEPIDPPMDEGGYEGYVEEAAEPVEAEYPVEEYAEEPAAPEPPAAPSGFRSAFSGFSLRRNRSGPAFNPSALSTATDEPAPAPAPAPTPTGWAATADDVVEEEEPVAAPSDFDEQQDWGLDANAEAIDPVYQESLAAADAFVDETADAAPPPPQARHRDHRLDIDPYGEAAPHVPRRRGRRYYTVFGVLALVAVGTATVLVLRSGGTASGEPPLITADTTPTRVFPDETNTAEPSNVVFNRVDPEGAAPAETNLLEGAEPVTDLGVAPADEDGIAAVLGPTETADATNAADLPRMVRTVTVLPDGTIVDNDTAPADDTAADTTAADTTAADAAVAEPPTTETPEAAAPATETPVAETPVAETPVAETPVAETPTTTEATPPAPEAATPAPAEVAAATPTEQLPTAATPIPAGIYVQVSAQGTEATAQATLQDFLAQAPTILGNEPTAIDRADLPQGTYYRVLFGPYSAADAESLRQRLAAVGIDSFIQRY